MSLLLSLPLVDSESSVMPDPRQNVRIKRIPKSFPKKMKVGR